MECQSERAAPFGRGPWLNVACGGLLAAALIAAGCGGSGSGEPTPIAKSDFIEGAEAVCAEAARRIESEFQAYERSGRAADEANELSVNEAAASVAKKILIPAKRQELEELRKLEIPEEDADRVNAMIAALDEGVEKAEARPERAARDGTEAFGKVDRLAAEYGIEGC